MRTETQDDCLRLANTSQEADEGGNGDNVYHMAPPIATPAQAEAEAAAAADAAQRQRQLDIARAWVNARRMELGLAPLEAFEKAVKGSCFDCLIARALTEGECRAQIGYWNQATAGRLTIRTADETLETDMPEVICQVANAFDLGQYPDLLTKR
jgi:hypothetical protein